ncbi:MAG: FtsQ-type POTRA domain-containing protein [Pyrinomonadaceae bacterium]|nr:FtsQ-type POTRA domain-containing protein [Pyrinomonadaceae bacterium]
MAAKKARKVTAKQPAKKARSRSSAQKGGNRNLLPIFLSACIIFCLGVIVYIGYRSVTASDFFGVAAVTVNGPVRSSKENIERIVRAEAERSGVWNADVEGIRARVEKLPFVRSVSVSRVLPNGIRVDVFEHEPTAVVKTSSGNMLVNKEGMLLAAADIKEDGLPFVLLGWNEEKSEKADKENADRIKLYAKMLTDWKAYGLAEQVKNLDLSDLRDPKAVIEDSGTRVFIAVGRENFGENLSRGIKAIAGKGQTFQAVDLFGTNMRLVPRKGAE